MGSRPSAHSLGSVLRLFVCLSGACLVSCWASTAAHRASRCFWFHAVTTAQHLVVLSLTWASIFLPSHHRTRVPVWSRRGRDSRLTLTPDTRFLGEDPPAQRRNAHRPLHQCMINQPISSLRFHPPSPSPRTAGSWSWSWSWSWSTSLVFSAQSRLASNPAGGNS